MTRDPADVIGVMRDRVLQRTVDSAFACKKSWAAEAREHAGPSSNAADMTEYAQGVVAFLEQQAKQFASDPSEAAAIRTWVLKIRKLLPTTQRPATTEEATVGTLAVVKSGPNQLRPLIGWQQSVVDRWGAMMNHYHRAPTPLEIIKYLREHDTTGCIVASQIPDELEWVTHRGSKRKSVSVRTIANTLTKLRRRGLIHG